MGESAADATHAITGYMQIVWNLVWWIVLMVALGGAAIALMAMWRLFTGGPGDDVRR